MLLAVECMDVDGVLGIDGGPENCGAADWWLSWFWLKSCIGMDERFPGVWNLMKE